MPAEGDTAIDGGRTKGSVVSTHDTDDRDDISAAFRIDDALRAVQAIHGGRGRWSRDREVRRRASARTPAAPVAAHPARVDA